MAISKITSDAIDATDFNLDSDTLTIDSTNNRVGIGTDSPTSRLSVFGSGGVPFRWGDTTAVGTLTYSGSDPIIQSNTGNTLFYQSGSESMRIDSSGNVGIGNNSPSTYAGAAAQTVLAVGTTTGNNGVNVVSGTTSTGSYMFSDSGGNDRGGLTYFHTADTMTVKTGGSEVMRIDSSGNVGIGTSSPDTLLNLESAAPTVRLAPTTQNNSSGIELGVLNAGTNAYAKIDVTNTVTYDTNIRFFTNTSGSTTQVERMRILHGGGLTFNGDSAQANALDDYEEGTWTPTLSGTATALFGVFHASYLKIGRKVTAQAYIQFASDSDGSPVKITMPFNSHNVTNGWQAGVIAYNTGFTGDHIIIQPNSNILEIRRGSGGNQRLYSEYSQKYIIFGITYITA